MLHSIFAIFECVGRSFDAAGRDQRLPGSAQEYLHRWMPRRAPDAQTSPGATDCRVRRKP